MLTSEDIIYCSIIIFALYYLLNYDSIESYKPNPEKTDIIGQSKMVHMIDLRRTFPNIVPFRDHVQIRIVNVPLTPFRAPLVTLSKLGKKNILPKFIMYKIKYLVPVRNQGDCGSCFAFAVSDMLADRAMIQSGGVLRQNLSVQQILNCFARDGCDGGSPEEVAIWLSDSEEKLVSDKLLPYKQGKGGEATVPCSISKSGGYKIGVARDSVVSIVEFIPEINYDLDVLKRNIINMKLTLYESGPFYCAMSVYDDFFAYTGLEPYSPSKGASLIGGHAIEVIGYCDKGEDTRKKFSDVGYWICRNSWGDKWPTRTSLNGYFTIVMGSNICGIESRCGYADVEVYGPRYKRGSKKLDKLRYISYKSYITD